MELFPDPHQFDKVYSVNTLIQVTEDGGKSSPPSQTTIAIRDLEIQKRENDLVAASFGRGFYMDDFSPLRKINKTTLDQDVVLFPIKTALQYVSARSGGGSLGDTDMSSPNPEFGATISFYLKEGTSSLKQQRKKAEAEKAKTGQPVYYPDWDDLAAERREQGPTVVISIYNEQGEVINKVTAPISKGFHRVSWDLSDHYGLKVSPGKYTATLAKVVDGEWQETGQSESFDVIPLGNASGFLVPYFHRFP